MRPLRALIKSPTSLFAFEAAARHLSFTLAAAELNVTQAAVSYNVRQLEQALGVRLFHRGHRAVSLTEAGRRFYGDVAVGLSHIQRSADALVRESGGEPVTVCCSTAFATYWFVPHLSSLRARNPQIDIRLATSDKDVELDPGGSSLAVRRGSGRWAGYEAALIAREEIRPVASPGYLEAAGRPVGTSDLAGRVLIHLDEPFRHRPSWADWFHAAGYEWRDSGHGLRLNDYALVIQAALAGEGVALGWEHLVGELVEKGLLVSLADRGLRQGLDFWVLWRADESLNEHAALVRDWMIAPPAA